MPRRNSKARINGAYWTVQYRGKDGRTFNVGHAATDVELLVQIANNGAKFPTGGKVIRIR